MVTVTSCAAIFGEPLERVPNGIEVAVELVILITCPFTDPVVTAVTPTSNVALTSAVIASEFVLSIANATTVESITAFALSFETTRTKKELSALVGLVIVP